ncbi:DUF1499 domain-containing protein [Geitlerinema sp. PCC 7407]|uniref:DUF1499 domain-containing protein n=1 Tax=Geitlerinema sp. PCC 7407 TaxID=1173025 RepID=UPI00029FC206|nr:DUF1499 domain-containing protein [Geitlerinema sp. PCC 7407]AFY67692.1 hypothetical protein GEI7407_3224 [Geitlerinema sp. PCC 7407]
MLNRLKIVLPVVLVAIALSVALLGAIASQRGESLFHFAGTPPTTLGVQAGHLAACPGTPNCVQSQLDDAQHQIAPLTYSTDAEVAFAQLQAVVASLPRTRIVTAEFPYLYAESTSALMGFVDDVEFYLEPASQTIQVRSASRLGESDLGVNRDRVETIRSQFDEKLATLTASPA